MTTERHVRLFRTRGSQTVRIPRGFELPGTDAVMRRDGDKLILQAAPRPGLLENLAQLSPLEEDLAPIDNPAPRGVEAQ